MARGLPNDIACVHSCRKTKVPQFTKVINVPLLDVSSTVSWIHASVPAVTTDGAVADVLHSFYERFDPGSKTSYELEAIAHKYAGKEQKLYETLEEKYGENPIRVFHQGRSNREAEESQMGEGLASSTFTSVLFSVFRNIHDPTSTSEFVLAGICLVLAVMALVELPLPQLSAWLPTKKEKAILLVGSGGTVGSGVAAAFRADGWHVVGVDPVFRGLLAYSGTTDDLAATIESVPDQWLERTLRRCEFVVYAADMGSRGRYQTMRGLYCGRWNLCRLQSWHTGACMYATPL